ncbi:rad51 domain-containing protein [Phthorimaea operculella]|nr:rad51 domain-containing protein [Phthorimaea operculella]
MDLKNILPPKIYEVIDRAGISSQKQLITLSVWDIKKLTNLRTDDIFLLKKLVAEHTSPQITTCDKLLKHLPKKIPSGCEGVDKVLRGGLRPGTVTEIYGESGSGKTQISLQAAAHNWSSGAVIICTEDLFPIKRFEQIKQGLPNYNPVNDYGKNIFVEHITEANDLLSCLRVRLPKLLEKSDPSLIIIDSITAPFRCEYTNYVQRAEELREVAVILLSLAQKHNLAVLCINQVTASFDGTDNVLPSLGLAWSNMISTRLWLKKTNSTHNLRIVPSRSSTKVPCEALKVFIRELCVIFAPDLPNATSKIIITPTGIQTV